MAQPLHTYMRAAIIMALFIPIATVTVPTLADDKDEKAAQLEQLKARIDKLQQKMQRTRSQHTEQTRALRRTEQEIGQLRRKVRQTDRQLGHTRRRIQQLQGQQGRLDKELDQHSLQLSRQIRSAYIIGRQPTMKLLLNQSRPETLTRVLTYSRYLNQARQQEIDSVGQRLQLLQKTESEIRQQQQRLGSLQSERAQKQGSLASVRAERKQVLARLKLELHGQQQQLKRLQHDEQQLQALLDGLHGIFSDIPAGLGQKTHFAALKRKIRLPVAGKPSARFGSPRGIGKLHWKGVFVDSRTGTPVAAAFRGRVAYADWLRGFGLLLILEHGDGYMTLYGHNESLYKEVGDWVETNEIIAASGNTGNPPRPGLYFEIRHNSKPKDPMLWCRVRRMRS